MISLHVRSIDSKLLRFLLYLILENYAQYLASFHPSEEGHPQPIEAKGEELLS